MLITWRRRVCFRKRDDAQTLAQRVGVANSFISRGVGLLNRSALEADEGLWIVPCSSIHMMFMRFSIDVIYLDKRLTITKIVPALKPWRFSFGPRHTWSVLELPAGALLRVPCAVGETLEVVETPC